MREHEIHFFFLLAALLVLLLIHGSARAQGTTPNLTTLPPEVRSGISENTSFYVKVWDDNVQQIRFGSVGNRPAMFLSLHGSACGKAGAEKCRKTLIWNGRTFQ
jgi:hypothetical protein